MPLRWLLIAAMTLVSGTTDLVAQLRSDLPPPVWQPTGARITWKRLSFIVPRGMTGAAQDDIYAMTGLGMRGRGGTCAIVITEIPSRGDLARDAQDFLARELAKLGARAFDSQGGSNLIADRRVGRSADGWRYVELNGMLNAAGANRARVMAIDGGSTAIAILAVSQPGNGCVGLSIETTPNSNTITWEALYYSLKLAGSTSSDHMRQQIVGSWAGSGFAMAGGALQDEVYAANGQYSGANFGMTSGAVTSSNAAGRYVVDADKLAIFRGTAEPEAYLARVVEDYSLATPSQSTVQLCKVRVDVAGPYERCLSRR